MRNWCLDGPYPFFVGRAERGHGLPKEFGETSVSPWEVAIWIETECRAHGKWAKTHPLSVAAAHV